MKHVTVILVSCKIVIREGGGCFFLKKKKDRNPWLVGEPHKYFNFVWYFYWYSLIYSLVDRDITKTDILLTISIQYQADRR